MSDQEASWRTVIDFPIAGRHDKPRKIGLSMVIDKGLGLAGTQELLQVAGDYIDFIKLGFGTSAFYNEELLRRKIRLVRSYGIDIYPGGTFFEVAWLQNKTGKYFDFARQLGFTAIEISDGTVFIPPRERRVLINKAKEWEFKVITEVGKKDPSTSPSSDELLLMLNADLDSEADLVIMEGRESGTGVGLFDKFGDIKKDDFELLLKGLPDSQKIMWEAPIKKQQQELILIFGPNVNLGNINPGEILSLEALRNGMRGDTLNATLAEREFLKCKLI